MPTIALKLGEAFEAIKKDFDISNRLKKQFKPNHPMYIFFNEITVPKLESILSQNPDMAKQVFDFWGQIAPYVVNNTVDNKDIGGCGYQIFGRLMNELTALQNPQVGATYMKQYSDKIEAQAVKSEAVVALKKSLGL